MNKQAAKEWLRKSWHNLSTAELLYKHNHYTDIIAVEVHYSCEKAMKSLLAYENKKILKVHDLFEIYKEVEKFIDLDDKITLLDQISEYHIEESYPVFDRALPPMDEMQQGIEFGIELLKQICSILNINPKDLK